MTDRETVKTLLIPWRLGLARMVGSGRQVHAAGLEPEERVALHVQALQNAKFTHDQLLTLLALAIDQLAEG